MSIEIEVLALTMAEALNAADREINALLDVQPPGMFVCPLRLSSATIEPGKRWRCRFTAELVELTS